MPLQVDPKYLDCEREANHLLIRGPMPIRMLLQRLITTPRKREREAAAQRECALRQDFARRTHALESQILLLRAENRALLNSVLGIAGIPPIMVTDPAELPFAPATPRDLYGGAHTSALSSRQRAEVWPDEGSAFCVGDDAQKQIPRTASRAPEKLGNSNSARDFAQDADGGSRSAGVPPANPSDASADPTGRQDAGAMKAPHARNRDRIIAPMRRRSWHQIYRMLEMESSRRKTDEPHGTT